MSDSYIEMEKRSNIIRCVTVFDSIGDRIYIIYNYLPSWYIM